MKEEHWSDHEGISNSSPLNKEIVDIINKIIRDSAHALIAGNSKMVAEQIVAHLDYKYEFVPTKTLSEIQKIRAKS